MPKKTTGLLPFVFDALLGVCHGDEDAAKVHLQVARQAVEAERATMFA
ncbi:hypothetical protein [Adlercreutzia sp. ZJ242]|nr:hypothetical protein [Adlercreutzia sp. ZJ242]